MTLSLSNFRNESQCVVVHRLTPDPVVWETTSVSVADVTVEDGRRRSTTRRQEISRVSPDRVRGPSCASTGKVNVIGRLRGSVGATCTAS